MPSLGADMESGVLVEWLVAPGQAVKRGQVVAVVETQKGAVEVEIWESGVVDQLVVQPGTRVPVGEVLAMLRDGEARPAAAPSVAAPAAPPPTPAAQPVLSVPPAVAAHVKASPAARKRAEALGVDLTRVSGSGPGGAITLEDVERAAPSRAPAGKPGVARAPAVPAVGAAPPADKQAAMRAAIAAAMAKSKREIPHYYLGTTIDVTRRRTGSRRRTPSAR